MASRLCAFAVLPLALAIVRRADVAEYHVDASAYPAVFAFPQRGECAATLIDNTHALTAAHCFSPGTAGVSMPMSVSLTDSSGNTVAATVRNRFLNPCFSFANDGPNGADLAVLELSSAVPPNVATPVARYTGSTEPGSTFTLIGWGNFGPASPSPPTPCTDTSCDQLREGRNVFDRIVGNVLEYTLDAPGSSAVLSDEAIAWSGDSGCPAFLNGQLAGVNSGGSCCAYGSTDQYVRVASQLSRDWIDATIAAAAAQPISDCSPWATGTGGGGGGGGGSSDDSSPCHPSSATVTRADGTVATLDQLTHGDEIVAATANGTLTTDVVTLLSIARPTIDATFIRLTVGTAAVDGAGDGGRSLDNNNKNNTNNNNNNNNNNNTVGRSLDLTGEHHLPVGATCCTRLKRAKDVLIGDTLWAVEARTAVPRKVVGMATVQGRGLHSPVLSHGSFPIIDGLVTSYDTIQ